MFRYDKIIRFFYTEKSNKDILADKYHFQVKDSCSKNEVKSLIESIYGVKVKKINTLNMKAQSRVFKGIPGQKSHFKKAIITLVHGYSISFT